LFFPFDYDSRHKIRWVPFCYPLSNFVITILLSMVILLILLIWFHHMDTILVVFLFWFAVLFFHIQSMFM